MAEEAEVQEAQSADEEAMMAEWEAMASEDGEEGSRKTRLRLAG